MRTKLDEIESLLESGFEIESVSSDETLDVELTSGETRITIRFDRDEVAEIWPRLFGDGAVPPRRRVAVGVPRPYGLDDVIGFWEHHRLDED